VRPHPSDPTPPQSPAPTSPHWHPPPRSPTSLTHLAHPPPACRSTSANVQVVHIKNLWNRRPDFLQFADHEPVCSVMEAVLGDDCKLIGMTGHSAQPGRSDQTLHTDYLPVEIDESLLASGEVIPFQRAASRNPRPRNSGTGKPFRRSCSLRVFGTHCRSPCPS